MSIDDEFDLAMLRELAVSISKMNSPIILHHPKINHQMLIDAVQQLVMLCPALDGREFPLQQVMYLPVTEFYFLDSTKLGFNPTQFYLEQ